MLKYNLVINKSVFDFLDNLGKYIYDETKNLSFSKKVINSIFINIEKLEYLPYSHQKFNEKYRVFTVNKNYRIFYEINESKKIVRIAKIYSSRQDYINYIK